MLASPAESYSRGSRRDLLAARIYAFAKLKRNGLDPSEQFAHTYARRRRDKGRRRRSNAPGEAAVHRNINEKIKMTFRTARAVSDTGDYAPSSCTVGDPRVFRTPGMSRIFKLDGGSNLNF